MENEGADTAIEAGPIETGKVQILLVEPFGRGFGRLQDRYAGDSLVQVLLCSSSAEAARIAHQAEGCLILCHVSAEEHFVKHLTMLRDLAEPIGLSRVRVLMTVGKEAAGMPVERIQSYGVHELISEPIPDKGLAFKVERALKSLPAYRTLVDRASESRESLGADPARKPGIYYAPALPLEGDIWSTAGGGARRLGNRWTIRLTGPGSITGSWSELDATGQPSRCWRWVPVEPVAGGSWYFRGESPPEIQGSATWLFTGETPSLEFIQDGDASRERHAKFRLSEDGSLIVAHDGAKAAPEKVSGKAKGPAPDSASSKTPSRPRATAAAPGVRMVDALDFAGDCWIFGEGRARRVGNRWTVRLVGPGPAAGHWVQPKEDGVGDSWQWMPHRPLEDRFIPHEGPEQGAWFFRGLAPRFEGDAWFFVSKRPILSFVQEGMAIGDKLACDDGGTLLVARDSARALSLLPLILETFNDQYVDRASEGSAKEAPRKPSGAGGKSEAPRKPSGAGGKSEAPRESKDSGDGKAPVGPRAGIEEKPPRDYGSVRSAEDSPMTEGGVIRDAPRESKRLEWEGEDLTPESKSKLQRLREAAARSVGRGKKNEPDKPVAQPAERSGPSASVLAVAFFVSEIVARREGTMEELSARYCRYLSDICGGSRAELWVHRDGKWFCAGTNDGAPGQLGKLAPLALDGGAVSPKGGTISVGVTDSGGRILGALALSGEGLAGVGLSFARASASMAAGILKSLVAGASARRAA